MFEREVKFIYDFNSNKVKKLGPTATFTELLPLGIHPAILQYISAEIEFRVFEDRQTLLKHSMFDYSGPKITQHFNKITDEIKKEKRFSTDFICKVILHATSFNVNYLIRPNWSLKKLIFDTSESNNVAEILQILNYAYFYKHILKVIRNYLDKKKLITLDKEEFGELLEKFDRVSLDTYGNDILESAIKAMSSFFNIGSMKQNTIPLQGIAVFLQEKKLFGHIERIQKNIKGEIKGKIEVNDLRSILFNVPMAKTEVIDIAKEPDEEQIKFESDEVKPETEEEKLEETTVFENEETKSADESRQELEDEKPKEKTKAEDEVEIKLRENKEKEIAEIEKSSDEKHLEETEYDDEPADTGETREEIMDKDETQIEDEEINEAAEYLVDQTANTSGIILTADDEEGLTSGHDEEELQESEKDETEDEETAPQADDETEVIKEEELKEKTTDDKEEVHNFSELYPSIEDDYSYPILETDADDEIRENDFEVVEDEELDDSNNDEKLKLDEEENTEDETIEDELSEDIEQESEQAEGEFESDDEIKEIEEEEETLQETLFGDIPDEELLEDSEPGNDFIEKFGSQNHAKRIDIADLLENKNMTRIIAVVFDYDMEEFANAIERICESKTSQEAFATLQEIFEMNQVNPSSKEAQAFKEIISEYFEQ